MQSPVDIANYALVLLGQSPIMSFDDDLRAARLVKSQYDGCRDQVLAEHEWPFASEWVELARLNETQPHGYQYLFQLPGDWLRVVATTAGDEYRLTTGNRIAAKQQTLKVLLVRRVEQVQHMDQLARRAIAELLAATLARPMLQDDGRHESMMQLYMRTMSEARIAAFRNSPRADIQSSSFVEGRTAGPDAILARMNRDIG